MHTQTPNSAHGPLTGSLGSAAPGRRQEQSPRSGCCSGLCVGEEGHRVSHGNRKVGGGGRFDPTVVWVSANRKVVWCNCPACCWQARRKQI